jgi:hypothetical protein
MKDEMARALAASSRDDLSRRSLLRVMQETLEAPHESVNVCVCSFLRMGFVIPVAGMRRFVGLRHRL